MISALKEVGSRGVHKYAKFSHSSATTESILRNWVTLQRYSPEQQETQTRNRGSSNIIVNIRDLLQQKDRGYSINSNLPYPLI